MMLVIYVFMRSCIQKIIEIYKKKRVGQEQSLRNFGLNENAGRIRPICNCMKVVA